MTPRHLTKFAVHARLTVLLSLGRLSRSRTASSFLRQGLLPSLHQGDLAVKLPNAKVVRASGGESFVIRAERHAFNAANFAAMSLHFMAQLALVYVPNRNLTVVSTSSQQT